MGAHAHAGRGGRASGDGTAAGRRGWEEGRVGVVAHAHAGRGMAPEHAHARRNGRAKKDQGERYLDDLILNDSIFLMIFRWS